jgi:hypothetical protein
MSDVSPDSERTRAFLRILAERATSNPAYMAWALHEYAESEGQELTQILSQLGIAESDRSDLMVYLRPTGDRFAEALHAIVSRFRVDELALASMLRQIEVLTALRGSRTVSADAGLLLAARMREPGQRRRLSQSGDGCPTRSVELPTGRAGERADDGDGDGNGDPKGEDASES